MSRPFLPVLGLISLVGVVGLAAALPAHAQDYQAYGAEVPEADLGPAYGGGYDMAFNEWYPAPPPPRQVTQPSPAYDYYVPGTGGYSVPPRTYFPQQRTYQPYVQPYGYGAPRVDQAPAVQPRSGQSARKRGPAPEFLRTVVSYDGSETPGTLVVDTPNKYLYLVQGDGTAIRYGIGVGKPGFEWSGTHQVTSKKEWPSWTPPAEMLARRPELPRHMAGGPQNPLGARALYLGSTLYRIHGSNEPWSIGHAVSSGCIRMTNDDVIDLYNRVPVGASVIVI